MLPAAGTGMLDVLSDTDVQPDWFTDDDLAVYTAAYRKAGFTGGLNWYRNFDRNWHLTEALADRRVEVPALFVAGQRDPVILAAPPEMMEGTVTDLRGVVLIPDVGHWTQQEAPGPVNEALLGFLREIGW